MKAFLAAAFVALAAVSLHPASKVPGAPKPLIAGGRQPDMLLMYTGDVIGYVDPCG
jgi:hypothetical protein